MQVNQIDLLFPSRAIESLRDIRGEKWQNFIDSLVGLDPINPDVIAFVLMMVKMGGCASCQSDSFRAMRGCILCSSTTIKRYKGTDQALIGLYSEARIDVSNYMNEV